MIGVRLERSKAGFPVSVERAVWYFQENSRAQPGLPEITTASLGRASRALPRGLRRAFQWARLDSACLSEDAIYCSRYCFLPIENPPFLGTSKVEARTSRMDQEVGRT